MNICIDKEFKNLIPPLTAEEYAGLEESILSEGCRDAIVLWGEKIIDGHNRYEICTKHGMNFQTVQRDFGSRDDVIEWIIKNQFGRRNLPAYERARLALRLKPIIAEVKNQHYYEAPPFDGHGLPPYQVKSRLRLYKEKDIRCLFFVHEPNTTTVYWQWLDVLDAGEKFVTKGKKQRVIYPLTAFHKMDISKSVAGIQ